MPSEKGTVHIIDDDEALRESLAFLLRTARIDVATYPSAAVFLEETPGAKLRDYRCASARHERHRPAETLARNENRRAGNRHHRSWRRAAGGRSLKTFDDEVLLASVRAAIERRGDDIKRNAGRTEIESKLAALSNRERDVLGGLVAGRANKQIAFDLGISPRTVEIYRANLMNKMQA